MSGARCLLRVVVAGLGGALLRETGDVGRRDRLLDLGLHADNGLRAVCEPDARAAIRAGEDVGFGGQRAELGWGAAIGADGVVREGERGVQVGKFGGRDEGGLRGRGCLSLGHGCSEREGREGKILVLQINPQAVQPGITAVGSRQKI